MPAESELLIAVLAAAAAAVAWLALNYKRLVGVSPSSLPGPKPHPLLGNFKEIVAAMADLNEFNFDSQEKYGSIWTYWLPTIGRLVDISDPRDIEHVFKNNFNNYVKGTIFKDIFFDLLGHGIFNENGEIWKEQRKVASGIFSVNAFRNFMSHIFIDEAERACEALDKLAASGEPVDLQRLFNKLTMDSFCRIGFGISPELTDSQEAVEFSVAFDAVQQTFCDRFFIPFWQIVERLNGTHAVFQRNMEKVDRFVYRIVDERIASEKAGDAKDDESLIARLASINRKTDPAEARKNMRDMCMNFLLAGKDTTASLLTWMFYELILRPEIESSLLSELQTNLGGGAEASYDDTKSLNYLNAFMQETLRLHPSVPRNIRYTVAADVLPSGASVQAGDGITFCPYAINRSKAIWGEDRLEFKPARFIQDGKLKVPSQYEFPVFHGGYRICLGKDMAQIEARIVLIKILRRFRFEFVHKDNIGPSGPSRSAVKSPAISDSITLVMKDGLKVRVHRR